MFLQVFQKGFGLTGSPAKARLYKGTSRWTVLTSLHGSITSGTLRFSVFIPTERRECLGSLPFWLHASTLDSRQRACPTARDMLPLLTNTDY